MRYFIEFAYNGKNYNGWQQQPNAPSVQETLGKAISVVLRDDIGIVGAGRTDTGVHAKQMFAHFDTAVPFEVAILKNKLNSYLPKDIAIITIHTVADDAHARFDAVKRTYEYHISTIKDVFDEPFSWYFHQNLDVEKMNQAAKILFEYNDFQCFSKVNTDVKTFLCKVTEAHWEKSGNKIVFTIAADRFLRNMVRAIVGTLVEVGTGKTSLEDFKKVIESKNRNKAGASAPAHGLFLTKVEYPYICNGKPEEKN